MKTKIKYFIILGLSIFIILSIVYKYSLNTRNIAYISINKNETKLKQKIDEENKLENNNNLEKSELNVLFVGDIMTDRYIRKQINKYENDSELKAGENFINKYLNNLREINSKYDYVVANLEGPITENKSKSLNGDGTYGKDLIFTFPTSTTQILKLLNIKVVSLANNHTDNFYNKGYQDTKVFLEKENINYFGNPYNAGGEATSKNKDNLSEIICEKSICIAYIGYNQFTKNNSKEIVKSEIERIKKENTSDFIVIFPHWGTEYEKISNQKQKDYARSWIDSGADLVAGSHPHVVQESEIYKDKYIYYSLGNYIFDQWFSKDVQNGLGLDMAFKKECKNLICKKEVILNKELKVFIDRNGVKYLK